MEKLNKEFNLDEEITKLNEPRRYSLIRLKQTLKLQQAKDLLKNATYSCESYTLKDKIKKFLNEK